MAKNSSDEKKVVIFIASSTFILVMILSLNMVFSEALPGSSFIAAFLSGFVLLLIIALCYLLFPSLHGKMKEGI